MYNPYYYTLFYEYTKTGVPPIRPLSFSTQDAEDEEINNDVFSSLDQFMIGSSLLAAPLVYPGK